MAQSQKNLTNTRWTSSFHICIWSLKYQCIMLNQSTIHPPKKPNTWTRQSSGIGTVISFVCTNLNLSISIDSTSLENLKPKEAVQTWPLVEPDTLIWILPQPLFLSHIKGIASKSQNMEERVLIIYERVNKKFLSDTKLRNTRNLLKKWIYPKFM